MTASEHPQPHAVPDSATGAPGLFSPWRWVAVGAAVVAAVAHLPVTPEHLHEAPYMGALFAAFALAALAGAAALLLADTAPRYALLGSLCAVAVATYAATRLVAFPQLADDVGNWTDPLGIVSVATELAAAAACALALRQR